MPSDRPSWFDELDLRTARTEAAMGTRALDPTDWLLVDHDWTAQRDEAATLLDHRTADVVASIDDLRVAPASAALAAELDRWLGTHAPEVADDGSAGRDLAACRRRVAEDLCLLLPTGLGWVLAAGAVCFPSHWRLDEKVGRPLDLVHGPVPGYADLTSRVEHFLSRLRPGAGAWRRNWSIHADPDLFAPDPPLTAPDVAPPDRWLRSEHQTLRRLPVTDAVVFTIRTQQCPLSALDRRDRHHLADTLEGWTPAVRAYKGGAVDAALLAWLHG